MSEQFVAAIDQGTTSTRCMIFNRDGRVVAVDQKEHEQIFPRAGWVEHDATEIWDNTREVTAGALAKADLQRRRHRGRRDHQPARDGAGLGQDHRRAGLQRDRLAGHPHRRHLPSSSATSAAAPSGTRTRSGCRWPPTSRGRRSRWILDNVDGAREKAEAGDLVFGNMDTWVIWNMTGGPDGGLHITDPTNASRTMLMDLDTLSLGRGHRRGDGHPAVDAAGDPVELGGVRRGPRARRRSPACRSPATSATSRRPRSARRACRWARPRTPTAPATSC